MVSPARPGFPVGAVLVGLGWFFRPTCPIFFIAFIAVFDYNQDTKLLKVLDMYSECYEIDWIEAHEKWEAQQERLDRAAQEQAVIEATELDGAIARSKRLAQEWGDVSKGGAHCNQCEFFQSGQCQLWRKPVGGWDRACPLAVCVYPF